MSSHDQPGPTTEQTPLLRDETLQHAVADAAGTQESQVPSIQESSTKELVLVLGSIWVGVFLAALGITRLIPIIWPTPEYCVANYAIALQIQPLLLP